jgi:hypothetical protein
VAGKSWKILREVILKDPRKGYTLDVDASIIESEKEEAKVTYKGEKGYQPQMGFLFEAGLIIEDEFREGNIPAGAGMVDFIKKCFEAMPVSKTITYLRGDSALYQAGVINLCFERGSLFTITAFYHAIATNREEAPEVIKLHNQRGQVENYIKNYIKERKTGFGREGRL